MGRMNHYPHLFQPARLGKVEIRNRIVMAAMGTSSLGSYRGTYSDRTITYYERRAKGETGLIVTGAHLVDPGIEPWEIDGVVMTAAFDSHWKVPNFLQLTERVHDFGSKIFVQLSAGFGRVFPSERVSTLAHHRAQPVAPSEVPLFWNPQIIARELTTEEVDGLVRAFRNAAVIAVDSGFDGIELHGHEGYLMDQFTCALWNRRTDKYGGDLKGRMHFVLSVIRVIQEAAGQDFPIIYRYGLEHKIPGGRTVDEGIEMAKMLEKAGVAALHVDAGCYDNWHWPHPPVYQPPGCMVDMAAIVKRHVTIPVIAVGRLGYPDLADRIIEQGKADFIALGRPLLADPDFAFKARVGEEKDIRPCIGCHECFARIPRRQGLSCAVNPACGDEARLTIHPAPERKRVLVVGGGIAGMEAARVCSLKGHEVTLMERSDRLGGTLHIAGLADFKQDVKRLLDYEVYQIEKSKVRVRLRTNVTPEVLQQEAPDVVFVATGAGPEHGTEIPGLSQAQWIAAEEVYNDKMPSGRSACVVGGGSLGCETAVFLAKKGWSVILVEMCDQLSADLYKPNQVMLVEMLQQYGVQVLTNTKVTEVAPGAVVVTTPHGEEKCQADVVVIATGRHPENALMTASREYVRESYVIGDCVAPGKIKDAVWQAFKLAITV